MNLAVKCAYGIVQDVMTYTQWESWRGPVPLASEWLQLCPFDKWPWRRTPRRCGEKGDVNNPREDESAPASPLPSLLGGLKLFVEGLVEIA